MNSKNIALTILSLVLLGGGIHFFWPGQGDVKNTPIKTGAPIVAFGDSLIAGVGASEGNDLPALLSRKLGVPVENFGESGDTTGTALIRLHDVLDMHPGLVIVLLGGNDFLKKVPRETTFKNLETIIAKCQEKGAAVLLLGVQSGIIGDGPEKEYKALAKKMEAGYVSNVLDGLFGDNQYMSDTIHPNDAGYTIIADRVYDAIAEMR